MAVKSDPSCTICTTGNTSELCDTNEGYESDDKRLLESFSFESEHLALKGNKDYQTLLEVVAVLEAQRIQAVNDLDKLLEMQQQAMHYPELFVSDLLTGKDLDLPKLQNVHPLPSIFWDQYVVNNDCSSMLAENNLSTRLKQKAELIGDITDDIAPDNVTTRMIGADQKPVTTVSFPSKPGNDNKLHSYNQLWSVEEQQQLEQLLIKYPPERFESRRFSKIAKELGTRTTQQVASRVQKYFIKLAKAGLPVPGRMPSASAYSGKSGSRRNRCNRYYHPSSTFMTSYEMPVYMSEDADETGSYSGSGYEQSEPATPSQGQRMSEADTSDMDETTGLATELEMLQRLRQQKLQQTINSLKHECSACGLCPLTTPRWQCVDCPSDAPTYFCTDCYYACDYEGGQHTTDHRIDRVTSPDRSTYQDKDYTSSSAGINSYLDPNYVRDVIDY